MEKTADLRYPIGKFEYGKKHSIEETRKQIKSIARLPKDLKKLLKKLRDGALDKSYRPGGWTARQVVHHLADSHVNAYIRFKLAATENAPIIKPYEEKLWADMDDAKHGPAKTSLKLLAALHARWVDFMTALSEDDLDRGYFHPANKRTVPLREAIALYAWHSQHHLAHIKLIADGKGVSTDKSKEEKKADKKGKGKTAESKKRSMSPEHKAKIAAAHKARRAQAAATPKPADEKPKRTRRTPAEVAAAKAAKAAQPKLSRAEILANARAARAAAKAKPSNQSKAGGATPKAAKSATTTNPKPAVNQPIRTRRTKAEVAAAKAAKAAQPKLSRAEILANARAAKAASRQKTAEDKPKRTPGSSGRPKGK